MKLMKQVLATGPGVLLAMASALPAANAHHRGSPSFSVSHSYSNYGRSNHGKYHPSYAYKDHRRRGHHGRDYYDGYYNGGNYGFGSDCGWLHCHTAMPWG